MGANGTQWEGVELNGTEWDPMGGNGIQWEGMGPHGMMKYLRMVPPRHHAGPQGGPRNSAGGRGTPKHRGREGDPVGGGGTP